MPRYLVAVGRAAAADEGLGKTTLEKEFGKLRWTGDVTFQDYFRSGETARQLRYGVD